MIKKLIHVLLCLTALIVFTSLTSCLFTESSDHKDIVTVTVVETVVQTVEVEKKSPYTYELLKEMAVIDNYMGEPASGHSIAFANISNDLSYASMIQESILQEWIFAGGTEDSIMILDNMADRGKAVDNAGIVFDWDPEVFIQFLNDINTNALIGMEAVEKNVYMIGIEVPVPGFPLMGINNYSSAVLAGKWAVDMIGPVYGGWNNVDRVVYLGPNETDSQAVLRIYGSKVEMVDSFGDEADYEIKDSRAVISEGVFMEGDGGRAMSDILKDYPEDENIIVFCLNDSVAEGVYHAALEHQRWDPDKWLIISQGLDEKGKRLISEGIIDANIAFFPEKYGDYLIPAALAYIYGNLVPPYLFMENAVITPDNIGEYYP
jgi:ribose transport system substrate-binding protein